MVLSYVTCTPVSADFLNVLVCFLTSVVIIPVLCFLLPLVGVRLALFVFERFLHRGSIWPRVESMVWPWLLMVVPSALVFSSWSIIAFPVFTFCSLVQIIIKERIFESAGSKRWPLYSNPARWSISHAEQEKNSQDEMPSGRRERKPLKYLPSQSMIAIYI